MYLCYFDSDLFYFVWCVLMLHLIFNSWSQGTSWLNKGVINKMNKKKHSKRKKPLPQQPAHWTVFTFREIVLYFYSHFLYIIFIILIHFVFFVYFKSTLIGLQWKKFFFFFKTVVKTAKNSAKCRFMCRCIALISLFSKIC